MTPPACYVISLLRSRQRRHAIEATLDRLGIPFDFVDAVDAAADPGAHAVQPRTVPAPTVSTLSSAERACALSHRRAQQRLLDSDASHALILEDDALPDTSLRRFIDEGHHRFAPLMLLFHSRARVYRRGRRVLFERTHAHRLAMSCTAAVAYTLDRGAAAALVSANTPVRHTADWPLDISRLGAHVVQPMPVGHPPRSAGQSTIAGARHHDRARWFSSAYLLRRWRKLRSRRIS